MPTVAAHGQRQELKYGLRSRRDERGVRAVGEGRRASYIHLQLTVTTSRASPKLGLLHTLRFLCEMQVAGSKLNTHHNIS